MSICASISNTLHFFFSCSIQPITTPIPILILSSFLHLFMLVFIYSCCRIYSKPQTKGKKKHQQMILLVFYSISRIKDIKDHSFFHYVLTSTTLDPQINFVYGEFITHTLSFL